MCKPTVFSLLFLHYEWHHITLGWRVMIREQCCRFDELCMKEPLSTLPSLILCKARLLKAILMCALVRPLCGPSWLCKLPNSTKSESIYIELRFFYAWWCLILASAQSQCVFIYKVYWNPKIIVFAFEKISCIQMVIPRIWGRSWSSCLNPRQEDIWSVLLFFCCSLHLDGKTHRKAFSP